MKKIYVLDTNVLLSDASAMFSFAEHDVIIPMVVLEELDKMKSRSDEVGHNARQVSRTLDDLRKTSNLCDGASTPGGGSIKIQSMGKSSDLIPADMDVMKADNHIIAFMLSQMQTTSVRIDGREVILVTKDINVRLKCDALGVKSDDYLKMRVTSDKDKLYKGVKVISLSAEQVNEFYVNKSIDVDVTEQITPDNQKCSLHPNEIVIVKSGAKQSAVTRLKGNTLLPITKHENVFGLVPRNKEQNFSLDLLLDENIKIVTLVGPAGTGKTLLALAAALDQLEATGTHKRYQKLIVTRPIQPLGKDLGFLPGTLEEKMEPWIAPIRDNLNFLMGGNKSKRRRDKTEEPYLRLLQDKGLIEIEAITYIRGRSIPNSFIVIDEAQNLSMHELKTIITRVGEGTKIVLTGDIEQIDNVHVDAFTNGLTYAVEKFKDQDIAAHVMLLKGERSKLATIASKIL